MARAAAPSPTPAAVFRNLRLSLLILASPLHQLERYNITTMLLIYLRRCQQGQRSGGRAGEPRILRRNKKAYSLRPRQRRSQAAGDDPLGEPFGIIDDPFRCLQGGFLVADGGSGRLRGVMLGDDWQVVEFLVVQEIESSRQRVQRSNRPRRIRVTGGFTEHLLGEIVIAQEADHIAALPGAAHRLGDLRNPQLLLGGAPARRAARDIALKLPARLEHEQLLLNINLRDHDPVPSHDADQMVGREPLHSLAHRRAADPDPLAQRRFRPHAAGRELQGDDLLFKQSKRPIGEPLVCRKLQAIELGQQLPCIDAQQGGLRRPLARRLGLARRHSAQGCPGGHAAILCDSAATMVQIYYSFEEKKRAPATRWSWAISRAKGSMCRSSAPSSLGNRWP